MSEPQFRSPFHPDLNIEALIDEVLSGVRGPDESEEVRLLGLLNRAWKINAEILRQHGHTVGPMGDMPILQHVTAPRAREANAVLWTICGVYQTVRRNRPGAEIANAAFACAFSMLGMLWRTHQKAIRHSGNRQPSVKMQQRLDLGNELYRRMLRDKEIITQTSFYLAMNKTYTLKLSHPQTNQLLTKIKKAHESSHS